jgi:hypothetical protein
MIDATRHILTNILKRATEGLAGVMIEETDPDTLTVRFPMTGNVFITLRAELDHVGVAGFSKPLPGEPFK